MLYESLMMLDVERTFGLGQSIQKFINPLSNGIKIKAILMGGGGIECPPSKNLENEATESCEGSK